MGVAGFESSWGTLRGVTRSHRVFCAVVGTLAAAAGGCSGCRHEPVLRLTYDVDVAAAYERDADPERVMKQTRDTIVRRLDATVGGRSAHVSTKGNDVVIELVALDTVTLGLVKGVVARAGRLEFDVVDDAASDKVFGAVREETLPPGEGLALYQEMAPDGIDPGGTKRSIKGSYARMACRPPSHAQESTRECLQRFRGWAATLEVPPDRRVAFQAVTEPLPESEPPRFEQVGWRTLVVLARPELANDAIADASAGRDKEFEQYYVLVSFTPSGAARFEEVTGANVNRRFAIVLDGIVDSAPVIKQKNRRRQGDHHDGRRRLRRAGARGEAARARAAHGRAARAPPPRARGADRVSRTIDGDTHC